MARINNSDPLIHRKAAIVKEPEAAATVGMKKSNSDNPHLNDPHDIAVAQDLAFRLMLSPIEAAPLEIEERKLPAPQTTRTKTALAGEEGASVAAGGVEDDLFSNLPKDVVVGSVLPSLGIQCIDALSQISRKLRDCVQEADKFAEKQLPSLKEELNQLITTYEIAGIQIPVGPFKNSMHQLRVLTAFKDALPNAITVLKDKAITDINNMNEHGFTPLHLAASDGQKDIVKALLAAGADVNALASWDDTPLHYAAGEGHTEILQVLIAAGADVNALSRWDGTPLHWAARAGHTEILQVLIAAGVDVNALASWDDTPLHLAAFRGHTDVVKALLAAGADVNLVDGNENSPLHCAASSGQKDIVIALLAAGSLVDLVNDDGEMPLHRAASSGHTEIVEILSCESSYFSKCTIM